MITVRHCRPEDAPAVREILRRSWRDAYGSFVPEEDLRNYLEENYAAGALTASWEREEGSAFLAFLGDSPAGYAKTTLDPDAQRMCLNQIYVDPDHQGRGVGRALMNAAAGRARRAGYDRIWLGVMVKNRRAEDWYRSMGFAVDSTLPFALGSTTVEHFIGSLPLSGIPAEPHDSVDD